MAPVRVIGLREFIRTSDQASRATKRLVREELAEAADPLREEAIRRFTPYSAHSASGYRISVRRTGSIYLVQRLKKVTGLHPEWGALQMREAFLPAADAKKGELVSNMTRATERIAERIKGA